jgi:hypothetical protein
MGWRTALLPLALCLAMTAAAAGQDAAETDTTTVFYQVYLNRLLEDLRLTQIQDLAKQWGVVVVGSRYFRMNRSFWEERLSLNLAMGLPASRGLQTLSLEYHLQPGLLMRGEVSRKAIRSEAWLDLIFHTEY